MHLKRAVTGARGFAIFCALLLLSGCVLSEAEPEASLKSSWVRPDDPQETIGRKEHPTVLAKYGGEYENPQAERMIAVIVGNLVAVSDDPSRVYKITILNSPKVNAFALPGGFLYVTRGLLALANDSSELAAVIAHEMAHVTANHAIIRQERLNSAEIGEKVVSEVLEDSPAGKIALAANQLRLSKFSRNQELQADTIGIRMIGRAGYDPFAAARFLETMSKHRSYLSEVSDIDDEDSFTTTHPSTPRRIELAQRHARFYGAPGIGSRERDRYLDGLDGVLYGDTVEEGFVRGQEFSHKGLGIIFEAPPGFRIENQAQAVLVTGPEDVATRFDATVLSTRTSLSDYLNSGWISGLVEETIREERVNGLDTAYANAVGEGWRFKVRVIRKDKQVFRFITAAPQTNTNLDAVSRQITSSFRTLSKEELSELQPLKIRIVEAKPGEDISDIASQMEGVIKPERFLRLMNNMAPDEALEPGRRYKIVTSK